MLDILTVDNFTIKFKEIDSGCESKKYLLALSGGLDSMVLLNLLVNSGISITAAHCNFNLRGNDSDLDQELVEKTAKSLNIALKIKSFDTLEYAQKKKISVEMAARNLRYGWFRELESRYAFDGILMAHHLNDSFETTFLNFIKGTGLPGLLGIPRNNNTIYRPLVSFSKEKIQEYALKNNISWREDMSNKSNVFQRNSVRNKIVPIIRDINPSFLKTFERNRSRLESINDLLNYFINSERDKWMDPAHETDLLRIKLSYLTNLPKKSLNSFLARVLEDFDFNNSQIEDLSQMVKGAVGKSVTTEKFRALVDRKSLIVSEISTEKIDFLSVGETQDSIEINSKKFKFVTVLSSKWDIKKSNSIAQLDKNKLNFPLTVRKWKSGDYIVPLGMRGRKKVSDILIDKKVDLIRKELINIFECNGEIVWVDGIVISDKYKITPKTTDVQLIIRE